MTLDDGRLLHQDGAPVAVVTGGSRGIGAACVRMLAADGFHVVVGFLSDELAAARVVRECPGSVAKQVDVADAASVEALFVEADSLGTLKAVVTSAGIGAPGSRLADVSPQRVRRLLEVNVLGSILCAREGVRRMSTDRGGEGGAIVLISSGAARLGSPGEYVDYAATKGAIDTLALGLGREVATEGIRVNAVRPGLIDTDFHTGAGHPGRRERILPTVPMGRAGTPEEVARAVAWLCSDEASYVTAAIVDVTGGR